MSDNVTIEKVDRYLAITAEARAKATPSTTNERDEERLREMQSLGLS